MGSVDGKVVFLTGAGAGIGEGIARHLGACGASVGLAGRTLAKVEAVAAAIVGAGGSAIAVRCDVNERSDVEAAVAATVDAFGPIDICVNNAQGGGSGMGPPLEHLGDDDVLAAHRGGPLATLYGMQACSRT